MGSLIRKPAAQVSCVRLLSFLTFISSPMAQQPPLRVIMYQPPSQPGQPPAPLRPASMAWLHNPAHIGMSHFSRATLSESHLPQIDGALAEPQYYYTAEELHASHAAACAAAGLLELSQRKAPEPASVAADGVRPSTPPPPPISIPSSPVAQPVSQATTDIATAQVHPTSPGTTAPSGAGMYRYSASVLDLSHSLPPIEYLLQIRMNYIEQVRGAPQRGSKVQMKPRTVTKMVNAVLSGTTRAALVEVMLAAHSLDKQYEAGPLSGPSFKLWWTRVRCVKSP